jgi:hydroxymethylglutaryl-CoA lyase
MSDLPRTIAILEEAPRDGLQSLSAIIPTADKIRLIEALAETGITEINCTSFVNTKHVPQMADAEAVADGLRRREGVDHICLWLNEKGFERARRTPLELRPVIVGSASPTFLRRNNNRTPEASLADQRRMRQVYTEAGLGSGPIYVFTAFGCNYEGDVETGTVVRCVDDLMGVHAEVSMSPTYLCLCDTVGAANPVQVKRVVGAVRDRWPDLEIGLHLHDTRGLGIANAYAGLELGVTRFDASVGGLGGCPFAGNKAAAGNIATEELVFLAHEIGVETGVRLEELIETAKLAQAIVGQPLPSRVMGAGSLAGFRGAG